MNALKFEYIKLCTEQGTSSARGKFAIRVTLKVTALLYKVRSTLFAKLQLLSWRYDNLYYRTLIYECDSNNTLICTCLMSSVTEDRLVHRLLGTYACDLSNHGY